ncbi:cyclin-T1-2 [Brachypodium distachyon]|uniref:Cyclin-like domain-containing protein n=1 Tax=Brachypodium distachyon TaxID=15368 RepID=I1HZU4_BRADI|nr:cyclin-T1-2 [Brachypodium distachyon]KQJ94550.1 hypothetical protein BRADI_3g11180v3 [Brachypodium distachyon]KQJ94551.1 hypothetical protein BRADI_3g11180v3 [Brachypodium distachyon]KQJ94552.1 hypothetical protein BRADI_3g11180v3 [Brachypodium distachyon]KQJ94555.2 hypothetical protein BRADI_3g11180v3 [Brachypodium distachyon]|eukprot:XP_003573085.1 cyclin-T1-2 [Brachypodium distachyon]
MDGGSKSIEKLSCEHMYSWYFTKEELEKLSPSRKDGITESKESEIRHLCCSFIRDVGIRLKIPQMTIATAIMFCHRFYLHQSLAKNGWQTIATVCVFLASKVEDTPCPLDLVTRVAYETMYRKDPATARRIQQKDVFEKHKALILIGERLLLKTIRFDFNIQHPYRPLLDAMKNLGITQKEVKQVAWNFVNDWLKTTLCLQYKPQYIAAGSLYLAAKLHDVKLPLHGAHVWWHQFDVAPKPLEAVIQHMMELVGLKKMLLARASPVKQKEAPSEAKLLISNSPDSVLNVSSLSTSSTSPDIGEPCDNLKVDSNQYMISGHTGDCRVSQTAGTILNVSANSPRKCHKGERLDQSSITKHSNGVVSPIHQTSSDKIATIDANAKCVEQGISNCNSSSNKLNCDNMSQASRYQHSDNLVNSRLDGGSLDSDVNSKCSSSGRGNVGSVCSVLRLAGDTAGAIENAPPVRTEVDHSSVELKKIDVARIKDLLMKRKRRVEIRKQDIPSDDLSEEAWIERELESGIEVGQSNDQVALDGLSADDWIERELESGIIVEPRPAARKRKL